MVEETKQEEEWIEEFAKRYVDLRRRVEALEEKEFLGEDFADSEVQQAQTELRKEIARLEDEVGIISENMAERTQRNIATTEGKHQKQIEDVTSRLRKLESSQSKLDETQEGLRGDVDILKQRNCEHRWANYERGDKFFSKCRLCGKRENGLRLGAE